MILTAKRRPQRQLDIWLNIRECLAQTLFLPTTIPERNRRQHVNHSRPGNLRQPSLNPITFVLPHQGAIPATGAFDSADKVIWALHSQELKQSVETRSKVYE